jgi:hypothetical protein
MRAGRGNAQQWREVREDCFYALWTPWRLITNRVSCDWPDGGDRAYLSNPSFVKMERAGQRSPRMTEFRRSVVALSIIQPSALISTSESDRGRTKCDSGNERIKAWR